MYVYRYRLFCSPPLLIYKIIFVLVLSLIQKYPILQDIGKLINMFTYCKDWTKLLITFYRWCCRAKQLTHYRIAIRQILPDTWFAEAAGRGGGGLYEESDSGGAGWVCGALQTHSITLLQGRIRLPRTRGSWSLMQSSL